MKPTTLATLLSLTQTFTFALTTASSNFTLVPLTPPYNWIAGPYLFPGQVIAGYNANLEDYNCTSWAEYILAECETFDACTSALTCQATNSGSTGGRFWFGYVFRGGATNESFYTRDPDTSDSIAWTIVGSKG